jgi:hypothetical protein
MREKNENENKKWFLTQNLKIINLNNFTFFYYRKRLLAGNKEWERAFIGREFCSDVQISDISIAEFKSDEEAEIYINEFYQRLCK